ncbi:unnamed protein product [Ambrosiozyma monospora]|uniref:Unnamed protein product n=1 Tax=Ambrosiozyma monospora TaxID=43982 RepID=A0ACB5UDQ7_AMBMO|nr:unnamed protein product [Ambrosiozyma monospora]
MDIILEIPEGTLYGNYFKPIPEIEKSGSGVARLLVYHPTDPNYQLQTNQTWMRGHTDGSGLTFIASQPLLALQIQDRNTKKWNYVSHTPNALVVNVGDAISHLSGGYFKSSIHRVATPPSDQQVGKTWFWF